MNTTNNVKTDEPVEDKNVVTFDMKAANQNESNSSSQDDDDDEKIIDDDEEEVEEEEEEEEEQEKPQQRRQHQNKKQPITLSIPAPKSKSTGSPTSPTPVPVQNKRAVISSNSNRKSDRAFATFVENYSEVELQQDDSSDLAFLFDVSNVTISAKHFLAMPLNALAVNLPSIMLRAANYGNTTAVDEKEKEPKNTNTNDQNDNDNDTSAQPSSSPTSPKRPILKFKSAFGFDNDVDRGDQNASITRNFHDALRFMGIQLSLFTAKRISAIQRAVDVALGVKLLDSSDVIVGGTTSEKKPRKTRVVLFSSDGDLEPAIDMALERNPLLQISVVCDKNSTSRDYLRWMETRRAAFEKDSNNQRRLSYVFLDALVSSNKSFLGGGNVDGDDDDDDDDNDNENDEVENQQQRKNSSPIVASSNVNNVDFYKSLLGPQQILECRRKDFATTALWISAMEAKVEEISSRQQQQDNKRKNADTSSDCPIVLRINQDEIISDQDLSELAKFVQTSPRRTEFIKNIRQLWFDHTNIGLSSSKKTSQAIVELCEGLENLRELHASNSHLTCEAFQSIATSMIKSGRVLYVNAASTPASYRPEISTKNFIVGGRGGFSGKTVKVRNSALGNGSVNARFVGGYRDRREARFNESSNNNANDDEYDDGDEHEANFEEQVHSPSSVNTSQQASQRTINGSPKSKKGKNKNQEHKQKRKYKRLAENDFTVEELLVHLEDEKEKKKNNEMSQRGRGNARGGRGRGRGRGSPTTADAAATFSPTNNNNENVMNGGGNQNEEGNKSEDGEHLYYRGRGRGRSFRKR